MLRESTGYSKFISEAVQWNHMIIVGQSGNRWTRDTTKQAMEGIRIRRILKEELAFFRLQSRPQMVFIALLLSRSILACSKNHINKVVKQKNYINSPHVFRSNNDFIPTD
jgi:hypothetical protein